MGIFRNTFDECPVFPERVPTVKLDPEGMLGFVESRDSSVVDPLIRFLVLYNYAVTNIEWLKRFRARIVMFLFLSFCLAPLFRPLRDIKMARFT